MTDAEAEESHVVFAEDGCRGPIVAKPTGLFLECGCDGIIKFLRAAGFDKLKPVLVGSQRAEQI
jgi:hypothetical protein